jgi:hypothetical protein
MYKTSSVKTTGPNVKVPFAKGLNPIIVQAGWYYYYYYYYY